MKELRLNCVKNLPWQNTVCQDDCLLRSIATRGVAMKESGDVLRRFTLQEQRPLTDEEFEKYQEEIRQTPKKFRNCFTRKSLWN